MSNSPLFTALAAKAEQDLQPYARAIAVMKELESWGKDEQGRFFSFETVQEPLRGNTLLLGMYNRDYPTDGRAVPAVIVGVPIDQYAPKHADFMIRQTLVDPRRSLRNLTLEAMCGGGCSSIAYANAETCDIAIQTFARFHMNEHPKYKEALAVASANVIDKIAPQPLKL